MLLSACGKTTSAPKPTPTPLPRTIEMPIEMRPNVSLVPRDDGHMLFLKIDKVPSDISQIEYEVLYNAVDGGSEMEKGVGDTIKEVTGSIERKILLGTESCTNGCKYKYDTGVVGGTITINFYDNKGQVSTFESTFSLKTTSEIKKNGQIDLPQENFTLKPKTKLSGNDFFILMKNYKGGFSVYSNSNNALVGTYQSE